ncbi:MAG: D-alanine--D-alanine ligase [Deltaproteobacteria bacterium]|nr:MAG: D-alanine--D-alanine ligase [Deltaproteobacteria bacterium]
MRIVLTHSLEQPDIDDAEPQLPAAMTTVAAALRELGHEVVPVDVDGALGRLVATLDSARPDLVMNTAEGLAVRSGSTFYPTVFDGLALPWVGSSPQATALAADRLACRSVAESIGIATAPTWAGTSANVPDDLPLPAMVASRTRRLNATAVRVEDRATLLARVAEHVDGAVVSAVVPGRDVSVPWLAGIGPDGGALGAVTFDDEGLDDAIAARLIAETRRLASVIGVGDVARFDWIVTPEGEVVFVGLVLLPSLAEDGTLRIAGARHGLTTLAAVLDAMVRAACARLGKDPDFKREKTRARVGLVYNLKRVIPTMDGVVDNEAEFDSPKTIDAIATAIRARGHEVVLLEADRSLLTRITEAEVDLVFNIAEGIRGRGREALVPAILDLLDIPYTGSDAATLAVTLDKALAKRLVREYGVATAPFFVMTSVSQALPPELTFPLIVKPVAEGSSKGVVATSVVHDDAALRAIVGEIVGKYNQGALVEGFLPGREFTVGLLGGDRPRVLPPMEIVFQAKAGPNPVYTFQHKQDVGDEVVYQCPAVLDEALYDAIVDVARNAWDALGCSDVARVDVRLDAAGQPCFIECNPLPGLTPGWSDLCMIATAADLDYESLIAEIMAPALRRFEDQTREGLL